MAGQRRHARAAAAGAILSSCRRPCSPGAGSIFYLQIVYGMILLNALVHNDVGERYRQRKRALALLG